MSFSKNRHMALKIVQPDVIWHFYQSALICPQITVCFWCEDVLMGETSHDRGCHSLTVGGRQNKPLAELKTCDKKDKKKKLS